MKARHGFTLIELLTVIAILAVLAALMLPSFAKTKDIAHDAMCRNNERVIYLAITQYCGDNRNYVPDGWYIMERQWQGWSWDRFLHNKMVAYIDPRSDVWLCPGWPADVAYQSDLKVSGTRDNPNAGKVPGTPRDFGEGYYYSGIFWAGPSFALSNRPDMARITYPRQPDKAKLLSCMPDQQVDWLGHVGPHKRNTTWNVLWLDGTITTSHGLYIAGDSILLCNVAGNWSR